MVMIKFLYTISQTRSMLIRRGKFSKIFIDIAAGDERIVLVDNLHWDAPRYSNVP